MLAWSVLRLRGPCQTEAGEENGETKKEMKKTGNMWMVVLTGQHCNGYSGYGSGRECAKLSTESFVHVSPVSLVDACFLVAGHGGEKDSRRP